MQNNPPIGYSLSPLAQRYVEEERTASVVRQKQFTCSTEELTQLLSAFDINVTPHALEFEKNLGGWCYNDAASDYGFGIFCSLQQGDNASAIAKAFRKNDRLFESSQRSTHVHGEKLPVWGTGHPRLFFQNRSLIPAGMMGFELLYFLGPQGEIYLYQKEVDTLLLVAGCGRTLLEQEALLKYTAGWNDWYRVHVCANVADVAAEALSVGRYAACTDAMFSVWANEKVQIRLIPDIAPCIMGTAIATQDPSDLLSILQKIKAQNKNAPLRLWQRANNLYDAKGLSLVSNAGVEFQLLDGAAPGHYDRVGDSDTGEEHYLPSRYNPLLWI